MHNSAQLRCFENGNDDFGVEAFWIGDAARVGYFVPLNGPLNGHPPSFHYARYISWHLLDMRYLLPPEAKADLLAGAHVCRHRECYWNSVSGDQFGEQTAIKSGKCGLKRTTLSPELVTEWIYSFPISVYVSYAMESMYTQADQLPNTSS